MSDIKFYLDDLLVEMPYEKADIIAKAWLEDFLLMYQNAHEEADNDEDRDAYAYDIEVAKYLLSTFS